MFLEAQVPLLKSNLPLTLACFCFCFDACAQRCALDSRTSVLCTLSHLDIFVFEYSVSLLVDHESDTSAGKGVVREGRHYTCRS